MKQTNIDLHNFCNCEIRWRQFKGRSTATAGLFCSDHDVFLDWLKDHQADQLIQDGIKMSPYLDRKKSKKTKAKRSSFYQKAKRRQIGKNIR